jgi:hypothetical protein
MRKLAMFFLGLLLFVPLSALAVEKGSDKAPPVAQTLVREGDFALRLADTLNLAKTDNEMDAERVLASVRIAPKNGWISDFPVTPDVLAEIKASVIDAAGSGRIKIDKKTAEDRFYALSNDLGLPVVADNGTGEEYAETVDYQDQAVIDDYYYDEGPPVITYYMPPPDYFYLYAWDPFPFWCNGHYFPGFYVLNNFTIVVNSGGTVIVKGNKVIVKNGGNVIVTNKTATTTTTLVSNRVVDRTTNKAVTIDPVTRGISKGTSAFTAGGKGNAPTGNTTRFTTTDSKTGAGNILRNTGLRERGTATFDRGGSGIVRRENRSESSPSMGAFRRDTAPSTTGRSFDTAPSLRGRSSDVGRSSNTNRSFDPAPSLRGRSSDVGRSFDPAVVHGELRGRSWPGYGPAGKSSQQPTSRTVLERPTTEGASPVGESRLSSFVARNKTDEPAPCGSWRPRC